MLFATVIPMTQDNTKNRLRSFGLVGTLLLVGLATPALASDGVPTLGLRFTDDIGDIVYYRTLDHTFLPGGFIGCAGVVTLSFTNGAKAPVTSASFDEGTCKYGESICAPFASNALISDCEISPFPPVQEIAVIAPTARADIIQEPLGCLRTAYVTGDLTGDDVEDTRSPDFPVVGDCD